jgi:hypothetical protein
VGPEGGNIDAAVGREGGDGEEEEAVEAVDEGRGDL